MTEYLTMLEEFDITRKIQLPHTFPQSTLTEKKAIAYSILTRDTDSILLISSLGFKNPSVLAGISEKNIEYIAKKAPLEYKQQLFILISDMNSINEVLEISKSMDEDANKNNFARVVNVTRYIKDNIQVFN
jgi:hypothetical protein